MVKFVKVMLALANLGFQVVMLSNGLIRQQEKRKDCGKINIKDSGLSLKVMKISIEAP